MMVTIDAARRVTTGRRANTRRAGYIKDVPAERFIREAKVT